jgi:hypothetical protein
VKAPSLRYAQMQAVRSCGRRQQRSPANEDVQAAAWDRAFLPVSRRPAAVTLKPKQDVQLQGGRDSLTLRLVGSRRSTTAIAGSPRLPNTRHSVRACRLAKRASGCSRARAALRCGTWTLRSSNRVASEAAKTSCTVSYDGQASPLRPPACPLHTIG